MKPEFEKIVKKLERQYENSTPLEKAKFTLQSFWIKLNLMFPILLPSFFWGILCVLLFFILFYIFKPDNRTVLLYVSIGITFVTILPWILRNLKFVDFVEDYLREKEKQNK
jgi:hypothetical protein